MSSLKTILLSTFPLVTAALTMAACGGDGTRQGIERYTPDRSEQPSIDGLWDDISHQVKDLGPTTAYHLEEFQRPRSWVRLNRTASVDGFGRLYVTDGLTVFRIEPTGEAKPYLQLTDPTGASRLEVADLAALPSGSLFLRDSRGCFYESHRPGQMKVFFPRRSQEDSSPSKEGANKAFGVTQTERAVLNPARSQSLSTAFASSSEPFTTAVGKVSTSGSCAVLGRMPPSMSVMAAIDEDTLLAVDQRGVWTVGRDGRTLTYDCKQLGNSNCGGGTLAVGQAEEAFFYTQGFSTGYIVQGSLDGSRVGLVATRRELELEQNWHLVTIGSHPKGGILVNMENGLLHLQSSGASTIVTTRPPLGLLAAKSGTTFSGSMIAVASDGTFYLVGPTHIYRGGVESK